MRASATLLALMLTAACAGQPGSPSPVSSSGSPAAGGSFATQILIGAGDIGQCGSPGPDATAALLDQQPGTVFTAGDNAYPNGSAGDFRDCYAPNWGRHRSRTWAVPGNHDYQAAGAIDYFTYFGPRAGPGMQGYYAYSLGAWRILALNSEIDTSAGSAQAAWLRNELASSGTGTCTAAYWHRPLASSGPHGDNPDMRDLFRILYDAGVEFIVNGHDHLYERFQPLDADGRVDALRGVREFVVGTGGAPLTMPVRMRAGSEVQGVAWGVVRFELAPGSYRWQFVPAGGESFQDSGFDSCH